MVSVTLRYRKTGVRPPVFVAGSFSDPEWVPREMDWAVDDGGESFFTKEIDVDENREYQYKFKVGYGNDWDLDEQNPTTFDGLGNRNNLLTIVPRPSFKDDREQADGDAHVLPHISPPEPSEPLLSSNDQNTEPGNTKRDGRPELTVSKEPPRLAQPAEEDEDAPMPSTPLFAHESLGLYDPDVVDSVSDHSFSPSAERSMSIGSFGALASDHKATDVDDPTLEKFPCDKLAVMSTLRKMSISMGESPIQLEDRPLSPVVASCRTSVDSSTDSVPSLGSLSPTLSGKRDSRLSHGSSGRNKSAVSLGSIIEESPRKVSEFSPEDNASNVAIGLTSDEEAPSTEPNEAHRASHGKERRAAEGCSVTSSSKPPEDVPAGSSEPARKSSWQAEGSSPMEIRWFITGGVVILAMGITWWKSLRG